MHVALQQRVPHQHAVVERRDQLVGARPVSGLLDGEQLLVPPDVGRRQNLGHQRSREERQSERTRQSGDKALAGGAGVDLGKRPPVSAKRRDCHEGEQNPAHRHADRITLAERDQCAR